MSTCNQSDSNLIDYLDEVLDPGPRASFERHLASCVTCTSEVSAYRQIQSTFRSADTTPKSPTLAPKTLTEARQAVRRPIPWSILVAASLLVSISLGTGLFDRGPSFQTLLDRSIKYAMSGQWFATVDALEEALAAEPNHPDARHALFNLAQAHLYSGDAVLGLDALDRLNARSPLQPEALQVMLMRARFQTDLGHTAEALAIYSASIAAYPEQADVINARSQDLTTEINQGLAGLGYLGYL